MNSDEAIRARSRAEVYRSQGDLQRALKFYEISNRLEPSTETRNIITIIKDEIRRSDNTSANTPHISQNEENVLLVQLRKYLEMILALESKYITPSLKIYIRGIILVIVVLVLYKYVLGQKLGIFNLPGDISYSTGNVYVSFPVVSCVLISFFLTALGQAFNSR